MNKRLASRRSERLSPANTSLPYCPNHISFGFARSRAKIGAINHGAAIFRNGGRVRALGPLPFNDGERGIKRFCFSCYRFVFGGAGHTRSAFRRMESVRSPNFGLVYSRRSSCAVRYRRLGVICFSAAKFEMKVHQGGFSAWGRANLLAAGRLRIRALPLPFGVGLLMERCYLYYRLRVNTKFN
ncbi:hypothetical protein AVEN_31256-1 [Araneus ventricosus]|uniref:Uncharacterized protein n=1 Tax=Araneus ventricosus TaxID=182803 RepID=A0A4Y2IL59_ARAVE|nr:hypothetical protein AVEN_31256-1 [Araneus ventricosus]